MIQILFSNTPIHVQIRGCGTSAHEAITSAQRALNNKSQDEQRAAIAWNLFFAKYDLLLSPTVAVQPFDA